MTTQRVEPVDERTPAAVIEDLTFLADHNVGAHEAARRTGFTCVKSLDKWLRRHGQVDLTNRLARQDYWPVSGAGPRRHIPLGRAS